MEESLLANQIVVDTLVFTLDDYLVIPLRSKENLATWHQKVGPSISVATSYDEDIYTRRGGQVAGRIREGRKELGLEYSETEMAENKKSTDQKQLGDFEEKRKVIYLDPDDDLNQATERLENTKEQRVAIVVPQQGVLRSGVALRLLNKRAREMGKDLSIISADRQVRAVAQAAGFRVTESLESPPTGLSPASRSPVRATAERKRTSSSPTRTPIDEASLTQPLSEEKAFGAFKSLVEKHFENLKYRERNLAKRAKTLDRLAGLSKVSLIFLGAFIATRVFADSLFGATNLVNAFTYVLAGVLTATIAGLNAGFKWESRSIELAKLAASTQAAREKAEIEKTRIPTIADQHEREEAIKKLLEKLTGQSTAFYEEASTLGFNSVADVQRFSKRLD